MFLEISDQTFFFAEKDVMRIYKIKFLMIEKLTN